MNLRRLKAVARKEFLHVLRDPRSLAMGIAMPMLLLFLFGYALTLDVDRVPLAVWDRDATPRSRELISRFQGSRYFDLRLYAGDYLSLEKAIDRRQALIALVIPDGFATRLARGEDVPLQVILDGSDPNTATIAMGYAEATVLGYSRDATLRRMPHTTPHPPPESGGGARQGGGGTPSSPSLEITPRVWFNSDMVSRNFIFPGLVGVIMMIISAILTSLCMAREWETGTIEQVMATPIRGTEMVLGKLAPYFCIGVLDLILSIAVGEFIFQVPLRGSLLLLTGFSLLFLVGALSLGMLISTIARSQLLASQLAIIATVLPAFLLSGFIFPIDNMPAPIRAISHIVVARYFVTTLRGIYLKDVGMTVLWPEALLLSLFALLALTVSILKFRKKLD